MILSVTYFHPLKVKSLSKKFRQCLNHWENHKQIRRVMKKDRCRERQTIVGKKENGKKVKIKKIEGLKVKNLGKEV